MHAHSPQAALAANVCAMPGRARLAAALMLAFAASATLIAQTPLQPASAGVATARPASPAPAPRGVVSPSATGTKPRTAFSALPRGVRQFDGVTFRIQTPVNIIGARAGKAGGRELARVSQRVEGHGKRIHVLHAGDHGSAPQGNFIWRLVLRYADGESRRFDFAYGVHVRNYWHHANETESALSDPDSSFAWVGTSEESDRVGADLRVSRTTLANPRTDVEVIGADYVSLLGQSSAYVLAVTLSDDGPAPKFAQQPAAPGISLLTFLLQGADQRPAAGSSLDGVFECDGFSVRFNQALTDSAGRVVVDVPTAIVSTLHYQARDAAGLTRSGSIEITPAFKSTQLGISFTSE